MSADLTTPPAEQIEALGPGEYHVHFPILTRWELKRFVWLAWGVRVPDVKVCPNHCSPFEAFADAFFAKAPVAVWKASRNVGGKTFTLATLGNTEMVALKADVFVLGGSGQQSERIHKASSRLWGFDRAPRDMLRTEPGKAHARLTNGAEMEALTASETSVRSGHPQRLRCDEIDEMKLSILDSALGQPASRDGVRSQVVLSSTHQHADGTMTEILKRAEEEHQPVYEWCYRESMAPPDGWLTEERLNDLRRTMAKHAFRTEVELQEPSAGGRAIDPNAVARMFRKDLGHFHGDPDEEIVIERRVAGAEYATGTDWGKDLDWTVIVTFRTDVFPMRLVAFLRTNRKPYPMMAAMLDDRVKRYPGPANHDATGVGNAVADLLRSDVDGVVLNNNKYSILSEYVRAIEMGELEAPFVKWMEREHRTAPPDAIFTNKVHTPDTIIAGALAYLAWQGGNPSID
jgi:hypothetical protein